jgi:hypothetical protein
VERLNSRWLVPLLFLALWFACGANLAVQAQGPDDVRAPDVDVPILMYHKVTDTATPCDEWTITKDLFEKQMHALSAYGYDTVSLQDFLDYRDGSATPPDHPVILTFDDGYQNLYTEVRPVLNSYGFMGTGFLITDYMGTSVRQAKSFDSRDPDCIMPVMLWSKQYSRIPGSRGD